MLIDHCIFSVENILVKVQFCGLFDTGISAGCDSLCNSFKQFFHGVISFRLVSRCDLSVRNGFVGIALCGDGHIGIGAVDIFK